MASLDQLYEIALNYDSHPMVAYGSSSAAWISGKTLILCSPEKTVFLDSRLRRMAEHRIGGLAYVDSCESWHLFRSRQHLHLLSCEQHFEMPFDYACTRLKVLHLYCPELFMVHCLLLCGHDLYLGILSNLMPPQRTLVSSEVSAFHVLSRYKVVIQKSDDGIYLYNLEGNTLELLLTHPGLVDATVRQDRVLLIFRECVKEVTDTLVRTVQLPHPIHLASEQYLHCLDGPRLLLYSYQYQQVHEVLLPDKYPLQQLEFLQDNLIALVAGHSLHLIFQPDYLQHLRQATPNRIPQALPLKSDQGPPPLTLFQRVKKFRNLDLDACIRCALRTSDIKALLLLCSRIRNYHPFYQLLLLKDFPIDKDTLKHCECFDKTTLKEEFVDHAIHYSRASPNVRRYTKFLIENAHIVPSHLFLPLLHLPTDAHDPPIVPNSNLIKLKAYKKCLQSSLAVFQADYFNLKQRILQDLRMNKGVLVNQHEKCAKCKKWIGEMVCKFLSCQHSYHEECLPAECLMCSSKQSFIF